MIDRRNMVMLGASAAAAGFVRPYRARGQVITAIRKHDPSIVRGRLQAAVRLIEKGDFEAFLESDDAPIEIHYHNAEIAGEDGFAAFSKAITHFNGRRDNKPLKIGAIQRVWSDEYRAAYLVELRRSQYFTASEPDDEFGGSLPEGYGEASSSWFVTFVGPRLECFRELDELLFFSWYSAGKQSAALPPVRRRHPQGFNNG